MTHDTGPTQNSSLSRRRFLSTLIVLGATTPGCKIFHQSSRPEPIIDIHQHLGYSGRSDDGREESCSISLLPLFATLFGYPNA